MKKNRNEIEILARGACVKNGHNNFNRWFSSFMHIYWNSSAIIFNCNCIAFTNCDSYLITITSQSLINCIINYFIN